MDELGAGTWPDRFQDAWRLPAGRPDGITPRNPWEMPGGRRRIATGCGSPNTG
jgi:hypothetical protein